MGAGLPSIKENLMTEGSSDDQKEGRTLNKGAIIPAVILLTLPAAVPLFFLGQVEETTNKLVLIGTAVCMGLLNVMLMIVLVRWFKRLKQDG